MRHFRDTGNQIGELAPEDWRGLEDSLQTLILADNALRSLPREAFSSLLLLETLDLCGNHLADLDSDVFRSGPPRLSRLLLADNQLHNVPYQQLASLRMLRTLDLENNNIVRLHGSEHQAPVTRLSLDTLNLDYNKIDILPSRAFQHFDIVNRTSLDGNPLVAIEVKLPCSATHRTPALYSGRRTFESQPVDQLSRYLWVSSVTPDKCRHTTLN
jgi:hypothetical protein